MKKLVVTLTVVVVMVLGALLVGHSESRKLHAEENIPITYVINV